MSRLTIDQALKKGVEAHKAGRIQEADRLYTSILKVQPEHPDANHNMGVLAVGIGKVSEALPFFKSALEANPEITQFWVSSIDALIKLDRLDDARSILDQAEKQGITGDIFDELGKHLNALLVTRKKNEQDKDRKKSTIQDPPRDLLQSLINLYTQESLREALDQSLALSQRYPRSAVLLNIQGAILKALDQTSLSVEAYTKALSIKPDYAEALNNMGLALKAQGKLGEAIEAYRKAVSIKRDYADAYNNLGVVFKEQGKLDEAIEAFDTALAIMPDNSYAYNNLGNTLKAQGRLDEAIEAYRAALVIKSDFVDAHNNMGNVLKVQGKFEESIQAYNKALSIKPAYAYAYNNMGVAFKEQGKLDEATDAYKKAISIKPDYADAYNNMGAALTDQGNLEEAIEAYNKALVISPDHAEAKENVTSLHIQVQGTILSSKEWSKYALGCLKTDINQTPKLHVLRAISFFVAANLTKAQRCVEAFKACDPEVVANLDPRDKVFCSAYCGFLSALLTESLAEKRPDLDTGNLIYHIGESHCLSYAHRFINMNRKTFRIVPSITFGAKAHHFSKKSDDAYKAITMMTLASIPKGSEVFISFGEIDCRPNEGFISAAAKLDQPLEDLIASTVEGYLQWFVQQNRTFKHRMYFLNVPAPIYNQRYSSTTNADVARVVSLFNSQVEKQVAHYELRTIDIFRFTLGQDGFSNGQFHIDQHHLGAKAIPEIERQLAL